MSDAPVLIRDNDRSQCSQSEPLFCASIIENGGSKPEEAYFTDLKQVSNTFQQVSNKDKHETIALQNDKNETNLIVLENGKMSESPTHNEVNITNKTSESEHDEDNLPYEDGTDSGTSSLDFIEDVVTGSLSHVSMEHDTVKSLPIEDQQEGTFGSLSSEDPQAEASGRSSLQDPQKREENDIGSLSHDDLKDTFNCLTHNDESQDIFSEEEISAILETWKPVWKEKKQMATDIFCRLFTSYPEVRTFFKDLSIEEIRNHKKLRGHALSFIYALKSFVDNVDDPETLDGLIRKMAVNHVGRGISGKEIAFVPNVFIEHLEECFPDIVTDIHRQAWKKFFGQIVKIITEESLSTK